MNFQAIDAPALKLLQEALKARGLYAGAIDGNFGPRSQAAYNSFVQPTPAAVDPNLLIGDGTWPWTARIDGVDIVLTNVGATAFGGDSDPLDNGQTACGYSTKGHPNLVACSLPMRHDTLRDKVKGYVLRGSPIPMMPFGLDSKGRDNPGGAHVDVTFLDTGKTVVNVPVIDLGPAKWAEDAIDLTVGLAQLNNSKATVNNFSARVSYRILGAAKYVQSA